MFQSLANRHLRSVVLETTWVIFAVIAGSALLASLVLFPLLTIDGAASFIESSLGATVLYALQYICALFVVLIVPFIQTAGNWRAVFAQLGVMTRPRLKHLALAVPAWVLYFAASFAVLALVSVLMPNINLDQVQDVGFDGISQPYEYVLAFVALAILPPLAEEAIFRGYLFGRLRRYVGFWPTTIAVSLAFAIVHLQINVGIDVFVLSVFLCYLREKTGSIWASVVLHSIKNTVAYVFLFILN